MAPKINLYKNENRMGEDQPSIRSKHCFMTGYIFVLSYHMRAHTEKTKSNIYPIFGLIFTCNKNYSIWVIFTLTSRVIFCFYSRCESNFQYLTPSLPRPSLKLKTAFIQIAFVLH